MVAISASAPVWGFPLDDCAVDSSARVVSYTASPAAGAAPRCADNLKAAYVLISDIASTASGREALSSAMNLCSPLQSTRDVTSFLSYLQTPLFDLSEGSYPFPTDYITFALTGTDAPLPPWAMQVMCEDLADDFGVEISGDTTEVRFSVKSKGVTVDVDWDQTSNNGYSDADVTSSGALNLAAAVAQSIQVWYNVTGTQPSCVDWASGAAPNAQPLDSLSKPAHARPNPLGRRTKYATPLPSSVDTSAPNKDICTGTAADIDVMTAWNALVCNEGINLVNWWAQGVGNDLYWPPNQARGYTMETLVPGSLDYCPYLNAMGLYGIPEKRDEWAFWMDTAYGGTRIKYASNIVFSNGNLDPWAPAGVAGAPKVFKHLFISYHGVIFYAYVIDMVSKDQSVVSLTIDMGGHHLDLFWPTDEDPDSVK